MFQKFLIKNLIFYYAPKNRRGKESRGENFDIFSRSVFLRRKNLIKRHKNKKKSEKPVTFLFEKQKIRYDVGMLVLVFFVLFLFR